MSNNLIGTTAMTATSDHESLREVSDHQEDTVDSSDKNVDHKKTIEELVFEAFNVKKRVPTPSSGLTGAVYGKRKSSAKKPVVAVRDGSTSKPANTKKVTIVEPADQPKVLPIPTKNDKQEIISVEKWPENQDEKGHPVRKVKTPSLTERSRNSTGFASWAESSKGNDLVPLHKVPENARKSQYSGEKRSIVRSSIANHVEPNDRDTRGHVDKERQHEQKHYSFNGTHAHKLLRQIRDSRTNLSELPSNWIKSMRSEDWANVNADEWAKIVTAANETFVSPTQTNLQKSDPSDIVIQDNRQNVNDTLDNQNSNKLTHFGKVENIKKSQITIQTPAPSSDTAVKNDGANQSMQTITSWTTVSSLSSVDTLHSVGNIENALSNQDLQILPAPKAEDSAKMSDLSAQLNLSSAVTSSSDENRQTTNAAETELQNSEKSSAKIRDGTVKDQEDLMEKIEKIMMEADADTVDELYEVYLPAFQKDPELQLDPEAYYESETDTLSCCSEKVTVQGEEAMEQRAWEIQMPEIFELIRLNAGHLSDYAMLNRSTLRAVAISKKLKSGKPDLVRLMRCLNQLMDPEPPKQIGNVVQNSKNTLIPFGNKLYSVTHLDSTAVYARTLTEDYEGFVARPVLGFFIFAFFDKNSHLGVTVDIVNSLVDYVHFCVFGCLPEYEDGFDKITTALDQEHRQNHKEDHEHSAFKSQEIFGDSVMNSVQSDGSFHDDSDSGC